jgi:ribosomal protein S18 acetylase RimI-like enzyme
MEHVYEPHTVSLQLRPATAADAAALADLGTRSFVAKFGHLYETEDLDSFLAEYRTERHYREELRDPGTRVHLAEDGGELLGYSLLVLGKGLDDRPLPHPARPAFLSQLYCDPAATGRGVGSALMKQVLSNARNWGADTVQLTVFSENYGAQRFYARYGFAKVADTSFWVGNHRDDEFLYELRLD